jgi:hypothetical protein
MALTLLPVVTFHEITNERDNVVAQIVNLSPTAVKHIEEDEDGFAIIHYYQSESIFTAEKFVNVLQFLTRLQVVDYTFSDNTAMYSPYLRKYLDDALEYAKKNNKPIYNDIDYKQ